MYGTFADGAPRLMLKPAYHRSVVVDVCVVISLAMAALECHPGCVLCHLIHFGTDFGITCDDCVGDWMCEACFELCQDLENDSISDTVLDFEESEDTAADYGSTDVPSTLGTALTEDWISEDFVSTAAPATTEIAPTEFSGSEFAGSSYHAIHPIDEGFESEDASD